MIGTWLRNAIALLLVAASTSLLSPCVWAQAEEEEDPFEQIVLDMKVAGKRLAKNVTAKPTQEPQADAVKRLDVLIAELEKECEKCRGSRANANPTRPANSSTVKSGPGGSGDLHGVRQQGDRWGELPPRERDRILQSLTEGFPAHYQNILESYYKRLATEKTGENAAPAPAAATSKEKQPQPESTEKPKP